MSADVVAVLTYRTWADGHADGHFRSGQAIVKRLVDDVTLPSVTVVDPFRNWLRVLARSSRTEACFPSGVDRRLDRPRRWARGDPIGRDMLSAYRRLETRLRRGAAPGSVLISCHPVLAAVADPRGWGDVVYFGWDDWRTEDNGLFAGAGGAIGWSYEQMALRDVNVITVSRTIADRIGARRATVVPNGVDVSDFDAAGHVPDWFAALGGQVALWVGSVEGRIDTEALAACGRELGPEWTVVLVGPVADPAPLEALRDVPNVVVRGWHARAEILAMIKASRVCLLPHVRTPLTEAMSPLKLYEYLAAGRPTVSSDLPPVRGVSDRVILVPPGGRYAPAVLEASRLPEASPDELAAFRDEHDWDVRYARFKAAALGCRAEDIPHGDDPA